MQDNTVVATSDTKSRTSVAPNTKQLLTMYLVRLGKIFSNVSILFAALAVCSILSVVLVAAYFLFGLLAIFIATIFTLGLIFVMWPGMWSTFVAGGNIIGKISGFLFQQLPVILPVCLIAALLSIFCLWPNRHSLSAVRIYVSFALLAIATIGIIILLVGVISAA